METQQQAQQKKSRRHKQPPLGRILIALIVVLLLIGSITVAILNVLGVIHLLLPGVVTVILVSIIIPFVIPLLSPLVTLFQWLFPFSPQEPEVPPPNPSITTHPPQQVIVQVLPAQAISQPAQPISKTVYHGIAGLPPPADPRSIQQREKTVKEVYAKLTQPDISAVVLTGIGGVGKSTLASLVYRYAEEQRKDGYGLFSAQSLWLSINATTTMADLTGTIFEALDKPLPDFSGLAPQNQALALFNALNTADKPRLVVLDQFENLLDLQTGQTLADRSGIGEWIDALNSQQAICRILLTSRHWPQGTREYPPTYMQEYHVVGLEDSEGIELLKKQGVQGTDTELLAAVNSCNGHAFSLTLLASLLRKRNLALATLFNDPIYTQLWIGNVARNVLDAIYMQQLDQVQRKLIVAFSVYREPVSLEAAKAIIDGNADIPNIQIQKALDTILAQHLLQTIGESYYELHAIVSTYAKDHFIEGDEQANRKALVGAHAKAANFYLNEAAIICPPRKQRRRSSDIHSFIEAVWQYCQAEQWQEAYDLIRRENIYYDLNLWGDNVVLLKLYRLLLSDKWQPESPRSAQIYYELGWLYGDLGQSEQALQYLDQALTIQRKEGDRAGEGSTLIALGLTYWVLGWNEQAIQNFDQALSIQKEVGDREGEASILNNQGLVYDRLGQMERAIQCYQQALQIYREIGDRKGEGGVFNNLGCVYSQLGQKRLAKEYLEQSFLICKEVGNHSKEGRALNNLGRACKELGLSEEAKQYYEQALEICKEVEDRGGEASTANNLGLMYDDLGQEKLALKYLDLALQLYRAIGDRDGEGSTLSNIGIVYSGLKEYDQAFQYHKQALYLRRGVEDRRGEGITLANLGEVYYTLGQRKEAIQYHEQALPIHREVGDREGEAVTLNNLGLIYNSLGKKRKALQHFRQALRIRRDMEDRDGEGSTLNDLGLVCSDLGQNEEALRYLELALPLLKEAGNRQLEGIALNNLGLVFDRLGQMERAIQYYEQALYIHRELENHIEESTTLRNLGLVYDDLGQKEQAAQYYEQALCILREIGDHEGEIEPLCRMLCNDAQ